LIETNPVPRIMQTITIDEPHVIEGIAPLWVDLDGDGRREIIVTQSAFGEGAQIIVYAEDGTVLGHGPAIGQSYRWRHQLAVAPFAVDGGLELAAVLTPHIGGVVEFYRWQAGALTIVAQQGGYTSHVLGSRNLDMAVAGDFDGDSQPEVLLPDQVRRQLGGVHRTAEGAAVPYTVPIGGQLVTNVAAVTLADGRIAVGVGRWMAFSASGNHKGSGCCRRRRCMSAHSYVNTNLQKSGKRITRDQTCSRAISPGLPVQHLGRRICCAQ
jgi:hypothetical protein